MTLKPTTNRSMLDALTSAGRLGLLALAALLLSPGAMAQTPLGTGGEASGGPLRLRQPQAADAVPPRDSAAKATDRTMAEVTPAAVALPGEFERFVSARRVGVDWLAGIAAADSGNDVSPLVPADYLIGVGDELVLTLWGSVDSDLALRVDRSGRITIPRVGPVMVSGVRYGDLTDVIGRRVSQVFKNFQLSVSLGKLRGVRVFVTGFATRPGAVVVSSLSSVTHALARAGGPSSAGSYRSVELRRGREVVATLDLYDLLLRGDRRGDLVVQPDDVIHVAPIGDQVALLGSVNRPAVFELKAGEGLADVLRMAAGFTPVADTGRITLERISQRDSVRVTEVLLPMREPVELVNGDVLRAMSAVTSKTSVQNQNKRIQVDGEVTHPGTYILPPGSTLLDALQAAGGLAPTAFVYGAEFTRETVRATQQSNYERALGDLELEAVRANAAASRGQTADDAVAQAASLGKLFDRLRAVKPTGRVVLLTSPQGGELPALVLEDGDRLTVPTRPTTVGIFGSVFNTGNYLYNDGRRLDDYLRLSGGMTRGADERSVFVVRANGSVVSAAQSGSYWFSGNGRFAALPAEPGDTIFVPEEWAKVPFIQSVKDWTQILYQFGIGIAGIKSAFR